jgi:hypothetical protein
VSSNPCKKVFRIETFLQNVRSRDDNVPRIGLTSELSPQLATMVSSRREDNPWQRRQGFCLYLPVPSPNREVAAIFSESSAFHQHGEVSRTADFRLTSRRFSRLTEAASHIRG